MKSSKKRDKKALFFFMRFLKKAIKLLVINLMVFLFLFELVSIILIRGFAYDNPPPFHTNKHPRIMDVNPVFGAWHPSNTQFFMSFSCFAVTYYFNNYGARDRNRAKNGPNCENRIIVLGDSFIEGVGVDTTDRFSNILENKSGRECLNFGVSGIGTTQMRLIYESLASQFEHNTVLVGLFPANDFDDDNFDQRFSESNKNRYRPYLKKDSSGFQLVYYLDSIEKSAWHPSNINKQGYGAQFKQWLKNYTHLGRITAMIARSTGSILSADPYQPVFRPRINDYSTQEMEILKYNLQQIKAVNPENYILVFAIPSLEDILEYQQSNKNELGKELATFCRQNQMKYVDLFKAFNAHADYEGLFLSCDGHWSPEGNQLAAQILLKHL